MCFVFSSMAGDGASAGPFTAACWTPRIHLTEERPPQPDDFPDSAKEQSLRALRTLAGTSSSLSPGQLPSALIMLCEHLPLPRPSEKKDLLPELPLDDSDRLWSTSEHRHRAETALQQMLSAAAEAVSLTKLLGKA
jgi:hypothetical protein